MVNFVGSKWRMVGLALGWLALVACILLTILAVILSLPVTLMGHAIIPMYIFLLLNLLVNIGWLYGTISYKPGFMLVSLIWWTIPVGCCVCFIFVCILRGIQYLKVENLADDEFPFVAILSFSMFFVAYYMLAVASYRSVKRSTANARRSTANNSRPNVSYEIPKGNLQQQDNLKLYPKLTLEV